MAVLAVLCKASEGRYIWGLLLPTILWDVRVKKLHIFSFLPHILLYPAINFTHTPTTKSFKDKKFHQTTETHPPLHYVAVTTTWAQLHSSQTFKDLKSFCQAAALPPLTTFQPPRALVPRTNICRDKLSEYQGGDSTPRPPKEIGELVHSKLQIGVHTLYLPSHLVIEKKLQTLSNAAVGATVRGRAFFLPPCLTW